MSKSGGLACRATGRLFGGRRLRFWLGFSYQRRRARGSESCTERLPSIHMLWSNARPVTPVGRPYGLCCLTGSQTAALCSLLVVPLIDRQLSEFREGLTPLMANRLPVKWFTIKIGSPTL